MLHARIFWDEMSMWRMCWYSLNFLFGVTISVLGIIFTMQAIFAQDNSGLFQSACRENALFFGSSPADAYSCSNTTLFYKEFYAKTCMAGGQIECSQYGACYPPPLNGSR